MAGFEQMLSQEKLLVGSCSVFIEYGPYLSLLQGCLASIIKDEMLVGWSQPW